jgi:hypothetical protein
MIPFETQALNSFFSSRNYVKFQSIIKAYDCISAHLGAMNLASAFIEFCGLSEPDPSRFPRFYMFPETQASLLD